MGRVSIGALVRLQIPNLTLWFSTWSYLPQHAFRTTVVLLRRYINRPCRGLQVHFIVESSVYSVVPLLLRLLYSVLRAGQKLCSPRPTTSSSTTGLPGRVTADFLRRQ